MDNALEKWDIETMQLTKYIKTMKSIHSNFASNYFAWFKESIYHLILNRTFFSWRNIQDNSFVSQFQEGLYQTQT